MVFGKARAFLNARPGPRQVPEISRLESVWANNLAAEPANRSNPCEKVVFTHFLAPAPQKWAPGTALVFGHLQGTPKNCRINIGAGRAAAYRVAGPGGKGLGTSARPVRRTQGEKMSFKMGKTVGPVLRRFGPASTCAQFRPQKRRPNYSRLIEGSRIASEYF